MVVSVQWLAAVLSDEACWEKANQNSACKLRQEFDLARLARHLDLDAEA